MQLSSMADDDSDDIEMIRMYELWNIVLLSHTSTAVQERML